MAVIGLISNYVEKDTNNKIVLNSESKLTFTQLSNTEGVNNGFVSKTYSAEFFNRNFTFRYSEVYTAMLEVPPTAFNNQSLILTDVDNTSWPQSINFISVFHNGTGSGPAYSNILYVKESGANILSIGIAGTKNIKLYLEMIYDKSVGAFGTVYAIWYTDALYNNVFTTTSATLTQALTYTVHYAVSRGSSTKASYMSGVLENYELDLLDVSSSESDTFALRGHRKIRFGDDINLNAKRGHRKIHYARG